MSLDKTAVCLGATFYEREAILEWDCTMESQRTEWKSSWDPEHLKTLCAFANTDGGEMTIGIDDSGSVIGVKDPEELLKDIPSSIRGGLGILPSVDEVSVDGKTCIKTTIKKQDRHIDFRGVFYRRVGGTTHRVAREELRSWILEDEGSRIRISPRETSRSTSSRRMPWTSS
jgi:ATP-dependent DNA helicase RecG